MFREHVGTLECVNTSSTPPRRRPDGARPSTSGTRRRGRHRAASPAPRREWALLGAGVGVLALGVVAALSFGGPIDVDEILTADETTTAITDVAPAPLSAEARGEMIQRHLVGVPVPFPRNVEIHDRVDVDNRLAWLQEDGRITAGPVPTTTGMPGYETPRGEFTVQRKVRDEISYVFDNEPMPFSVYFTTTGVAFHEGDLTQDSHGCIHLSHQDAVHFFDVLEPNDIVVTI